jgi:hypothetical protein
VLAVDGDSEQLVEARVAGAAGREQDCRAIGSPAEGHVDTGVIGQAAWLTTGRGNHVDIEIAVILAGESDLAAIGRVVRAELPADTAGQPAGLAAIAADGPQVAGIAEGDVRAAERGFLQKQWLVVVGAARQRDDEQQAERKDDASHGWAPKTMRASGYLAALLTVQRIARGGRLPGDRAPPTNRLLAARGERDIATVPFEAVLRGRRGLLGGCGMDHWAPQFTSSPRRDLHESTFYSLLPPGA